MLDDDWKDFHRGEKVTSVQMPNTIKEIGESAFDGCVNITAISVPETVTKIGGDAFNRCFNLNYLYLGKNLSSIEYGLFSGLGDSSYVLKEIKINPENPYFSVEDGILFDKNLNVLVCCPPGKDGMYSIPKTVNKIKNLAFTGCNLLKSITIPNSVTEIGDHAFFGCSSITSITIPNSITSIPLQAFAGCDNLSNVELPSHLKSIGYDAFGFCALTDVKIPDTVELIDSFAFSYNKLESVFIPQFVSNIGNYAFSNNSNLTSVYYAADEPKEFNTVDIFDDQIYSSATLYVQENAVSKCKRRKPWRNFKSIQAYDFAGINVISVDSDTDTNLPCEVYTVNGVKIADSTDNLAPGIYIVHQGTTTKKIVVN